MGTYLINGDPIDVPDNNLKVGDLKKYLSIPTDRLVVVTLQDDSIHHLQDHEAIPVNATEISILPAFRYGL